MIATRRRWVPIDVLKAAATLTVVWIHTAHGMASPASVTIYITTVLASFAVPAFFFAAGFVRWRPSLLPLAAIRRSLARLLPPYLIASIVWLVAETARTRAPIRPGAVVSALIVGNANGIFYFVPMLAGALLLTLPLSRWPRLGPPALVILGLTGWLCQAGMEPLRLRFFWSMRDPLRWWGFFVAGWCMAAWVHRNPAACRALRIGGEVTLAVVAALSVLAAIHLSSLDPSGWAWPPSGTINYATTYAVILGVLGASMDAGEHRAVRFMADASYPVYLYHIAFVEAARALVPLTGLVGLCAVFALGCVGSVVFVGMGRMAFGRWSPVILGA